MARKKHYVSEQAHDERLEEQSPLSRSQKKRNSTALQALGEELIALSPGQLLRIPLNEDLQEALQLMARIKDYEGRRRQKQYIGRLMRECNVHPIQEALEQLRQGHSADTALLHHAERLREALLVADTQEENRLLAPWPEAQDELRTLTQHARTGDTRAKRELFRKLRHVL